MARRPVGASADADVKSYLSNAPETVALAELAWVDCLRWTIEEDFKLAKAADGLDHYEVTEYRGWYHHMTLCLLLALAFLKPVQFEWGRMGRSPPSPSPSALGGHAAARAVGADRRARRVSQPATQEGRRPGRSSPALAA